MIYSAATAILLTRGIRIHPPDIPKKTLDSFKKHLVDSGFLDVELLGIYKRMIIRAAELLGLFQQEKLKRGNFVYRTIPQANIQPAKESIEHAQTFVRHVVSVLEK